MSSDVRLRHPPRILARKTDTRADPSDLKTQERVEWGVSWSGGARRCRIDRFVVGPLGGIGDLKFRMPAVDIAG